MDLIAGARPNFMKIAPILHAIQARQAKGSQLRYHLAHTGQHYDARMSCGYLVLTLHRPANVDDSTGFARLISAVGEATRGLPAVFPLHPRTATTLATLPSRPAALRTVEPQPYLECNYLVRHARGAITDSGGVTEASTVLGVPCISLGDTTERSEAATVGTDKLIGTDPKAHKPALDKLFGGRWKRSAIPGLSDGRTGTRIVEVLDRLLCS